MSEQAAAAAAEEQTGPRPGNEAPTGWHIYDGRPVIVQLFDPYVTGMTEEGPLGTPVLHGVFKVTEGAGGAGALLFILHVRDDKGQSFITLQPGDVKHITYREERERPSIVTP